MSKLNKKPRNTKQLEVVWEAVKDDNSHPTADQVYDKVRERLPNVSLGTVYRNLQNWSRSKSSKFSCWGARNISTLWSSATSILSAKSAARYTMF
jgi:hypothetical protein